MFNPYCSGHLVLLDFAADMHGCLITSVLRTAVTDDAPLRQHIVRAGLLFRAGLIFGFVAAGGIGLIPFLLHVALHPTSTLSATADDPPRRTGDA